MKTVTKIILCSCVFCYFAGLWTIAQYGLEYADQIPEEFLQTKYLYIGLAVYTVLFVVLSYVIYRYSESTAKEQETLQQESAVVASYGEHMNTLLSQYERSGTKDSKVWLKLHTLSRQIASLPPTVARNTSLKSEVANIVSSLQDLLADNCPPETFAAAIDNARDAVDSIKRRSITIKQ